MPDVTPYDTSTLPAVVKDAIELYQLEDDANGKQRRREKEDLEFQVADPEHHWTEDARKSRQAQTINGQQIPGQPMLAMPVLDQPIQLVLNQERAAHLAVTVHPLSEDADDDTAEVYGDLYRTIQRDSGAGMVRSWAFNRGVKAGRGAYRILTEADPNGKKGDLRIAIKRILFQESARWDPFAQEPDFSDADWAMVSTWVPWARLKRQHPKAKIASYTDGEFVEMSQSIPAWIRDGNKGKACLVVEFFRKEWKDERTSDEDYVICWYKLTCTDVLDEEEMDCRDIPLVPTIGNELIPFDDERRWEGIIRPNKDAARLVDYAGSNAISIAALEPRAPWMIAEGQDQGFELEYQLSGVRNFPSLHYKPVSLLGQPVPPPARTQVDVSRLGPSMQLLQMGQQFVHGGTGAFEAALGQAAPNAKTKGGTLALQQQHDQGNSHWLDNQVEITLACEARIILNWIPFVYDRPGRIVNAVTVENKTRAIMLNQPFVMGPDKRPVAAPEQGPGPAMQPPQQPGAVLGLQQPAQPKVKHYDLKKGRYGIVATAGKSYKSRVEEGSDRLGQLLQADPALMPILGPNWMHFQDFPGHQEAEKILRKMRDQQFPWLADEDEQPSAAAQLSSAKMQLQKMQQQLQQAAEMIKTDQAKQQATVAKAKIDALTSVALQKMKDATSITVAQINALTKGVQMDSEAMNEAAALGQEQHAAVHDRAHDVAMAAQEHAHSLEQAQQAHEQGLQAADVGQQHALQQQDNAAALEPPPDEPGAGDA